ncbi:MAG: enoyl-CoA hydratase/isomerase family protein, partial [Azospirillaceae bacterium]
MTGDLVRVAFEGPVALVTLNRPEKMNALDQAMVAGLEEAAARIEASAETRIAILTGAGEKAFSTGGDINAWAALDPIAFARTWIREGHRVFDRLARLRQPLIVCLNGHAFGGGLELAATGDLIVAEEQVRLGMPETGLGMTPGWSGTQRLVRRFGSRAVRRMALAGEMLTAEAALAAGIVDRVAPRGAGLAMAREMATAMAARGPVAMQVTKQLINAAEGEEVATALESLA